VIVLLATPVVMRTRSSSVREMVVFSPPGAFVVSPIWSVTVAPAVQIARILMRAPDAAPIVVCLKYPSTQSV